ncbi:FACT complex subunit [Quaeritorhiza haematococci]|nr:FACT complex subunit [Quaeritorhiza haematococci]
MGEPRAKEFDNIYLGGKAGITAPGKMKLAEAGIGWKEAATGKIITIPANEIKRLSWLRAARDYQLGVYFKNGNVVKFDGFQKEVYDSLNSICRSYYQLPLEVKELSLRGWNWGSTEFQGTNLSFVVGNKPAFEVPLTEVANTSLANKSEVSVEFAQPAPPPPDPSRPGSKRPNHKEDMLMEIRFYMPGMATLGQVGEGVGGKKQIKDKEEGANGVKGENGKIDVEGEDGREEGEITAESEEPVYGEDGVAMTAAELFCDTIKQRADVGSVQGEAIVSFQDMLCLTPRGRFEVELHADFFRLRGKSHDYKVLYSTIVKLFLLPKPDYTHFMFVIGLEPPLRQGQTRYPFLVFQFDSQEELECELNMDDETWAKYEGRLQKKYDQPTYEVVGEVFKGLANKKLTTPGAFKTAQGHAGIKCSQKANEATLYPLEKAFLSLPKPPILLPLNQIRAVTFSRVGGSASSTTKTFEVRFSTDKNAAEYTFSSIPREEYQNLEAFCKAKKLVVTNEMEPQASYGVASDLDDVSSEDEDLGKRKRRGDEDQDDEDEESEDEDFVAKSESDVAEEFSSEYESSSGSDEEGGGDVEEKKKAEKPPKKKKASPPPAKKTKKSKAKDSDEDGSPSPPKKKAKAEGKAKKDKNEPKKGLTAFMFFSKEKRPQVVADNPGMAFGEVGKAVGQLWSELSKEDKEPYEQMAKDDKERYERDIKEYKKKKAEEGDDGGSSSKGKKAPTKAKASSSSKSSKPKEKVTEKVKSAEYVDSDEDDMSD